MTVRVGREFLSIPGPTNIPEEVLRAMHRPAIDIYTGDLVQTTETCLQDLKTLFGTAGRTYIYAANGHGAWEAALSNVLCRGDRILVLESGRFAIGWGEMARMLGIHVDVLPGDWQRAVDVEAVTQRLKQSDAADFKAILVVQVDTASAVYNDIAAIRRAIDAANHPALLMVDAIASLGTMPFEMDEWGVDVAVTGSQKGLMTPPGLSFIAAGKRAVAAHQTADLRTHYWDWTAREGEIHYNKYCGTPPEHLLFGLRKALDMLMAEGLQAVYLRHRLLAESVRQAVAVWREAGALDFNIVNPQERADSVTTVVMDKAFNPGDLLHYCDKKCGVVIGIGIGDLSENAFRIAHMGYVNAPMILGTLGVIETGLVALNIPHGKGGVSAAIHYLGGHVAAA